MKRMLLLALLANSIVCCGQRVVSDNAVSNLSDNIASNNATAAGRIRAAYEWVTSHIRYDTDSAFYFNWSADLPTRNAATLRRRRGVCENFASLFSSLLSNMNIQSYVVYGTTSGHPTQGHAWVAVHHEDEWYLCDPTWDAAQTEFRYFMQTPEIFLQTHTAFDPIWNIEPSKLIGKKQLYDSIESFLRLDSFQRFVASNARVNTQRESGSQLDIWYRFNEMNIAILKGDRYMQLYNSTVDLLNKATHQLNKFIAFRNNQFKPSVDDNEIRLMLGDATGWLQQVRKQAIELKAEDNFQYDPGLLLSRHDSLLKKLEGQQDFLRKYLEAEPADRVKLFY